MREFFRRMSKNIDKSLAEAQQAEERARQENERVRIQLQETQKRTAESIKRLDDLPQILAEDHARHVAQMRKNAEERAANKARRERELEEARKRSRTNHDPYSGDL